MDDPKPETRPDAPDVKAETPAGAEPEPTAALGPSEEGLAAASPVVVPATELPAPAAATTPVAATVPPLAASVDGAEGATLLPAAYEHPWAVRFCHWLNAVSLLVMITSGLQIFNAFANFGPKVPEKDLFNVPEAIALGGWLGGALQWHFTFMWIFVATGVVYLAYQFVSGHYKTTLFTPKDISGIWPMVRHYFLFGPKPPVTEQYNPLQKLAYTTTWVLGTASVLTGIVLYKPVQFSWLTWLMGGFHLARLWHFAAMCGFLAFIPGHLLMVALHGWDNFASMLTGWKKRPEYLETAGGE
jgi:Ni/Fe-hydrogenase b-type cytochrome subunit